MSRVLDIANILNKKAKNLIYFWEPNSNLATRPIRMRKYIIFASSNQKRRSCSRTTVWRIEINVQLVEASRKFQNSRHAVEGKP